VTTVEDTLGRGDIYVTCTGNLDIIRLDHMKHMKDQAIVRNQLDLWKNKDVYKVGVYTLPSKLG
jgi:S-adenosylhomocysteine hydrolase